MNLISFRIKGFTGKCRYGSINVSSVLNIREDHFNEKEKNIIKER